MCRTRTRPAGSSCCWSLDKASPAPQSHLCGSAQHEMLPGAPRPAWQQNQFAQEQCSAASCACVPGRAALWPAAGSAGWGLPLYLHPAAGRTGATGGLAREGTPAAPTCMRRSWRMSRRHLLAQQQCWQERPGQQCRRLAQWSTRTEGGAGWLPDCSLRAVHARPDRQAGHVVRPTRWNIHDDECTGRSHLQPASSSSLSADSWAESHSLETVDDLSVVHQQMLHSSCSCSCDSTKHFSGLVVSQGGPSNARSTVLKQ